jgi:hypothetical protein
MDVEATPEPDPAEEGAIREALADADPPGESPWWRAGLPGGPDDAAGD